MPHTGRTDIALTERGEREAQVLGARLKDVSFTKVLTSPLQRARRTGHLAGFAEYAQADPDLVEWDYGIYEGRRTSEIRAERPGWRLFEDDCPGGETLAEVSARAKRVLARFVRSEATCSSSRIGTYCESGGNDYPAKEAGVVSIQVKDPHETKRVIEAIIAFLDLDSARTTS